MATAAAIAEEEPEYATTADGDLAVRIAHLVMALVPTRDGGWRTMTAWPARDPSQCRRSDFNPSGFRSTDEAGFRAEAEEFALHHRELVGLRRRDLPATEARDVHTPWGTPDRASRYAQGVVSVSTPGHGGIVLSADRNAAVDRRWRIDAEGDCAFYEEDQNWAIVAATFPLLFTAYERRHAEESLMRAMPDQWEAVTGRRVPDGYSPVRERERFRRDNADRWIVGSAVRSKLHPGKVLVSASVGGRDRLGRTAGPVRNYLLDDGVYETRLRSSGFGECVIEESADMRVDHLEHPLPA